MSDEKWNGIPVWEAGNWCGYPGEHATADDEILRIDDQWKPLSKLTPTEWRIIQEALQRNLDP